MRRRFKVGVVDREVAFAAGVAAALPDDEFEAVTVGGASAPPRGRWDVMLIDERLVRDDDTPIDGTGANVGVLVAHPDVESARDLLRRGAHAVIPRNAGLDALEAATCGLAAGEVVLPVELISGLVEDGGGRHRRVVRVDGRDVSLTGRQAEIVELRAEGLSNPEIAARLSLSAVTVRRHLSDARRAAARAAAEPESRGAV